MLILIRFSGEISTKAKQTRILFTRRLVDNIRDALDREQIPFQIRRQWSRLFVETPDPATLQVLTRIFGIRSLSVVERISIKDLAELLDAGERLFSEKLAGKSFAVRARRVGGRKDPRFSSTMIQQNLGGRLLPYARRVDLTKPEITVNVEVNNNEACFYTEKLMGTGGLPLGTQERALALISGGFDSAVAAWHILKRGVALDYLFLNLAGEQHLASMLPVIKILADRWSYGDRPKLYVIDFQRVIQEMQKKTETRYWQVILKRLMMKAGEQISHLSGSLALVTGEAIGQVSSQTLTNLNVISQATELPILRPIVSFDKHEIVEFATKIGTGSLSEKVDEYCALVAKNPATSASLEKILEQESKLDFSVLERAIAERVEFDLHANDLSAITGQCREIERIPDGAQILDLRSGFSYNTWHYPGAAHKNFFEALEELDSMMLDPNRPVVAYCEIGIKSAQIAEKLCKAGFDAYHFRGGIHKLMEYALENDLLPIDLVPSSMLPG